MANRAKALFGNHPFTEDGRKDEPIFLDSSNTGKFIYPDFGLDYSISTTSLQQRQADGVHDGHRAGWLLQSAGYHPETRRTSSPKALTANSARRPAR